VPVPLGDWRLRRAAELTKPGARPASQLAGELTASAPSAFRLL
jgi:hypothetical protein